MDAVPTATRPDADTPADTIQTLTANVAAMTQELKALRRENDRLHDDNADLVKDRLGSERALDQKISETLKVREQRLNDALQSQRSALEGLGARLDEVSRSITTTDLIGRDIPPGFGFDELGDQVGEGNWHWIEPLDRALDESSLGLAQLSGGLRTRSESTHVLLKPVYTVPRNAHLARCHRDDRPGGARSDQRRSA